MINMLIILLMVSPWFRFANFAIAGTCNCLKEMQICDDKPYNMFFIEIASRQVVAQVNG